MTLSCHAFFLRLPSPCVLSELVRKTNGESVLTTTVLSGVGIDYHPPNPGFIVYQAIVSVPAVAPVFPRHTGPESFNAEAYSNQPTM